MTDLEYKKCHNEFTYRGRQFNDYTTVENLDETCNFRFLETDIIVATFPRSGTTFTQEIVWQIKNRKFVKKDEQVESAMSRFPFIELNHKVLPDQSRSFAEILMSQKDDPYRLIKTHVPYEFIKENVEKANPKMIVVMRNPKDCLVSNFHFYVNVTIYEWSGSFDDFFPIFFHGKTYTGSYFDNNLEWWGLRERSNVLIIFYEDLVKNLSENVKKIAKFLGENLTNDELEVIVHNSSFAVMKENPKININLNENFTFLRKGVIGDWKNYLSDEQNKLLEEKIMENFDKVGLKFDYE